LQKFQVRAGWWSTDGNWFAFESNRICNETDGQTYAIFIQDAKGMRPAMQVTDCNWNIQHPKWFPPRKDGKTLQLPQFRQGRMNRLGSQLSMFRGSSQGHTDNLCHRR
jgi:hypothetical protein